MPRPVLLLSCLLVASCAKDHSATPAATPSRQTMSEKFNGPPIKQNADGKWSNDVEKASAFDSKRKSPYFVEKSTVAKAYKTGEYTKTTWWGKKDVAKPSYAGNTDGTSFQISSRFQGAGANEATTPAKTYAPYQTGTYQTTAAREGAVKHLDKTTDAETDNRRRVFPDPEISDWKQQRALDVKTTKSILGHD
jgi:hypothetical protein